jgi:glycogen debranching enzyme
LHALIHLAEAMNDFATAVRARRSADQIAAHFHQDWWDETQGTYAMSIDEASHELRHVPHWAVITPLEVGLAAPDHADTTLVTLRQEYLNEWGLKHTSGDDERVWTLPTAVLSRGAYRYGHAGFGFEMLSHLPQSLEHGSIGMFHELIPDGLCFVQLWSAAIFVRGVIEDLLGIDVRADLHRIRLAPRLPDDWKAAELQRLTFGPHILNLRITRDNITVQHTSGPEPLHVIVQTSSGKEVTFSLEPGKSWETPNR